jgi:propionate CoA-transferase
MKIVSAPAAASLVQNGDAVLMSGSGGGHGVPEAVLAAIELRFLETGAPA